MKKTIKLIKGFLFMLFQIGLVTFATRVLAQGVVPEVQTQGGTSKINLVGNLPDTSWQMLVSQVIQLILGISGILTIVAFTVGGVMMLTALGNEDKINKGKEILFWSIIALTIIALSYGAILGVTNLVLTQPLDT